MKFDPHYFVTLAHEFGLDFKRENDVLHYTSNGKFITGAKLWREAIAQHKDELIDFLPDKAKYANQLDIFNDPYP